MPAFVRKKELKDLFNNWDDSYCDGQLGVARRYASMFWGRWATRPSSRPGVAPGLWSKFVDFSLTNKIITDEQADKVLSSYGYDRG